MTNPINEDISEVARIAEGLTKAQREMILRGPGRYQDAASDVIALLDCEVFGTVLQPIGLRVKAYLQSKGGDV